MTGEFPAHRPRRLRASKSLRRAFAETSVASSDLIAPLFVKEGIDQPLPIPSMPGHSQHTLESLVKEGRELAERGVAGILLFGIPRHKDPDGTQAFAAEGIAQRGLAELKRELGDELLVIADLCMCEYTDHGHCGVLTDEEVDNDRTLDVYGSIAASQATAGADLIAPSGMMDGQVAAIRASLDRAGFEGKPIMSYAVKFASSFYGPFRDAAEGAPRFGDRRGYQEDPSNLAEAMREVEMDIREGADAIIVKPALPYLDVLHEAKRLFSYPTAAYNVSGEYAMVVAAAEKGWVDERAATLEVLTSIRRAGADLIITYHAKKAAEWLS